MRFSLILFCTCKIFAIKCGAAYLNLSQSQIEATNEDRMEDYYEQYIQQLVPTSDCFPSTAVKVSNKGFFTDVLLQDTSLCQIAYCINEKHFLRELEYNRFKFPDQLLPHSNIDYNERITNEDNELVFRYNLSSIFTNTNEDDHWIPRGGGDGYVLVDHDFKRLVVCFRGSRHLSHWITNFDIYPAHYKSPLIHSSENWNELKMFKAFKAYKAHAQESDKEFNSFHSRRYYTHAGFKKVFDLVFFRVLADLLKEMQEYPSYSVVVTGHSLGGALATLLSLELNLMKLTHLLVTSNSPAVFSPKLSKVYQRISDISNMELTENTKSGAIRVFQFYDLVPRILPSMIYRHVGKPISVYKKELPHRISDVYILRDEDVQGWSDETVELDVEQCGKVIEFFGRKHSKKIDTDELLRVAYHSNLLVYYSACNEYVTEYE